MLAEPLNVAILRALAEGPLPLIELRRAVGLPPQTTMRGHLRKLSALAVLEKRRQAAFPGVVDLELAGPGRDLLNVAEVLSHWLAIAPGGQLELGTVAAKSAIKALVQGWSTTVIRALVARPLSLTELNRLIPVLSYPSLERRLGAMRLAKQIEACTARGRGRPYAVTAWLRHAVGPLATAARWERRHAAAKTRPIGRLDVEAAFLLAVPLLRLPEEHSGTCRLAVEVPSKDGDDVRLAGVRAGVERGQIVSCLSGVPGGASAWASGSAPAWLAAVLDDDSDQLELGGDCALAEALVEGLHGTLARTNTESRGNSDVP